MSLFKIFKTEFTMTLLDQRILIITPNILAAKHHFRLKSSHKRFQIGEAHGFKAAREAFRFRLQVEEDAECFRTKKRYFIVSQKTNDRPEDFPIELFKHFDVIYFWRRHSVKDEIRFINRAGQFHSNGALDQTISKLAWAKRNDSWMIDEPFRGYVEGEENTTGAIERYQYSITFNDLTAEQVRVLDQAFQILGFDKSIDVTEGKPVSLGV